MVEVPTYTEPYSRGSENWFETDATRAWQVVEQFTSTQHVASTDTIRIWVVAATVMTLLRTVFIIHMSETLAALVGSGRRLVSCGDLLFFVFRTTATSHYRDPPLSRKRVVRWGELGKLWEYCYSVSCSSYSSWQYPRLSRAIRLAKTIRRARRLRPATRAVGSASPAQARRANWIFSAALWPHTVMEDSALTLLHNHAEPLATPRDSGMAVRCAIQVWISTRWQIYASIIISGRSAPSTRSVDWVCVTVVCANTRLRGVLQTGLSIQSSVFPPMNAIMPL